MTDQERKTMKMALEAMDLHVEMYPQMDKGYMVDARAELRKALSQSEQHPVAWLEHGGWGDLFVSTERKGSFPVFKYPPSKPWVSLTDEDLSVCDADGVILARYWEAKLKEKNT